MLLYFVTKDLELFSLLFVQETAQSGAGFEQLDIKQSQREEAPDQTLTHGSPWPIKWARILKVHEIIALFSYLSITICKHSLARLLSPNPCIN